MGYNVCKTLKDIQNLLSLSLEVITKTPGLGI